ncbi:MAG: ParB/RepB/Spo0J family partition protein [Bacilli bacterium]|nr:ParB/RepB/Spo0J family partition protein [Bacilli bacterium]
MNDGKDEVVQLYLDDIIPNRFQPREVFDEKALKELAVSIKEHGVIQPIIVRNVNGKYEIIAGERRYKASALAGMTKIPAIIRNLDDKESSKVALLENLQRKNLNPIEEARTYQKILEIDQMTQDELAKTMGKSQSAVANKIRLLSLPDEVQSALLKEQISERHARSLLNITDPKKQKDMLKKVIDNKMSVRQLEDEIKEATQKEKEIKISEEPVDIKSSYINSSPLLPTSNVSNETPTNSNYGIFVPPAEEVADTSKFVNFSNVRDDDDDDLELPASLSPKEIKKPIESFDVNSNKRGSAALDNMLNINQITGVTTKEFLTPAEKLVKTDPYINQRKPEDYFKTPDLASVSVPVSQIPTSKYDSDDYEEGIPELTPVSNEFSGITPKYSIENAKDKVRDLIEELKNNGVRINIDEMDFEKSYQIIIKIDKE